ncbi:MAG: class I poly(R)-hydroxyalkanoic acid synthase [Candidatus Velthaea sp.]
MSVFDTSIGAEEFGYGLDVAGLDMASLNDALRAVITDALTDPVRMMTWSTQVALADQAAGMNMLRRLMSESVDAAVTPAAGDKRFIDAAWQKNPMLAGMLESYLVRARAALALVESSRLPDSTRHKARFALQMLTDAVAPSNLPWVNPTVVKEAVDTGGGSLMRGMKNYLEDVASNEGKPRQVDRSSFHLGKNIAATPGRIVFQNELIELIAYEPQTPLVHAIPLLCSPPWINKYYIMDLAPNRSFIEWAIRHGHQTFAISYRNPDASMAKLLMDDYLRLGLLAALEAIEEITGSPQTNIAALCLGGTMTLVLLAYLAALGQGERVAAATVTNTLVDFSEPGDLGVFTDEATIARLEAGMSKRGFLESDQMAGAFDWMRANDLVWSYVVNNWFMGKQPPAFDILSWNADSTRMPAAMHSQYLRTCYLNNAIVRPNAVTIAGAPIDLGAIRTPLYVLGAEGDHIAPWRSSYKTIQHVGSRDMRYTLSNAGHIAGIVNPANNPKAWHRTKDRALASESADAWFASSERVTGRWWEDWAPWAETHGGDLVPAYELPPGDPAPGRYVRDEADRPEATDGG